MIKDNTIIMGGNVMKVKYENKKLLFGVIVAAIFLITMIPYNGMAFIGGPLVPGHVKRGDLLFLDLPPGSTSKWARPNPDGYPNDHVAIYLGHSYTRNGITGDWFIDSLGGDKTDPTDPEGVQYHRLNFFTSRNWVTKYGYVKIGSYPADQTLKDAAADWAEARHGASYQYFFEPIYYGLKHRNPDKPHPMANRWYCMELPWAAYYNQGVDIDRDEWQLPKWVSGNDIIYDSNFEWYCMGAEL